MNQIINGNTHTHTHTHTYVHTHTSVIKNCDTESNYDVKIDTIIQAWLRCGMTMAVCSYILCLTNVMMLIAVQTYILQIVLHCIFLLADLLLFLLSWQHLLVTVPLIATVIHAHMIQ